MSKITVIGSASGMPVPNRSHASLLLQLDEMAYLLDAGEGCSSSLLRCGIDHHRIGHVFISHMHPDHCSGLPMLIQMMYLTGRKIPLGIFVPEESVEVLTDWLAHIYIFPEKLPFTLTISPIGEGTFFRDEHLRVTAHGNRHLHGYSDILTSLQVHRTLESYSFVLEAKGTTSLYSGDLASLQDLVPQCEGPDILFLEATHIPIDEILQYLLHHRISKTVLTHIPPEMEGQQDHILSKASHYGINTLMIAADGLEIDF